MGFFGRRNNSLSSYTDSENETAMNEYNNQDNNINVFDSESSSEDNDDYESENIEQDISEENESESHGKSHHVVDLAPIVTDLLSDGIDSEEESSIYSEQPTYNNKQSMGENQGVTDAYSIKDDRSVRDDESDCDKEDIPQSSDKLSTYKKRYNIFAILAWTYITLQHIAVGTLLGMIMSNKVEYDTGTIDCNVNYSTDTFLVLSDHYPNILLDDYVFRYTAMSSIDNRVDFYNTEDGHIASNFNRKFPWPGYEPCLISDIWRSILVYTGSVKEAELHINELGPDSSAKFMHMISISNWLLSHDNVHIDSVIAFFSITLHNTSLVYSVDDIINKRATLYNGVVKSVYNDVGMPSLRSPDDIALLSRVVKAYTQENTNYTYIEVMSIFKNIVSYGEWSGMSQYTFFDGIHPTCSDSTTNLISYYHTPPSYSYTNHIHDVDSYTLGLLTVSDSVLGYHGSDVYIPPTYSLDESTIIILLSSFMAVIPVFFILTMTPTGQVYRRSGNIVRHILTVLRVIVVIVACALYFRHSSYNLSTLRNDMYDSCIYSDVSNAVNGDCINSCNDYVYKGCIIMDGEDFDVKRCLTFLVMFLIPSVTRFFHYPFDKVYDFRTIYWDCLSCCTDSGNLEIPCNYNNDMSIVQQVTITKILLIHFSIVLFICIAIPSSAHCKWHKMGTMFNNTDEDEKNALNNGPVPKSVIFLYSTINIILVSAMLCTVAFRFFVLNDYDLNYAMIGCSIGIVGLSIVCACIMFIISKLKSKIKVSTKSSVE